MPTDFRCLWCHRSLRYEGSLSDMFFIDDCLCDECRNAMSFRPRMIHLKDVNVLALYPYEGRVREMLIQYKENRDEALFPAFLWPFIRKLNMLYRGCSLIPMPSSERNIRERGFRTVEELFSVLSLPQIPALRKTSDVDQKGLNSVKRRGIGAYMALEGNMVEERKKIVLADDIITTGATISAAASLLKEKKVRMKALCVSYAVRHR